MMNFFRWRQRKDEELDAEIQTHLDEAVRDRMARCEHLNKHGSTCGVNSAIWV